ncbi:multisubunit sodium/proton antiporter MrpE subunit [Hasllibacter halocynthiae]|uniref:Multisubunit sodium/proton antiporter MrpE subunit n=1 Tax=Hasllibacter halocynthiae TaxID=595589 RepID=A0A2T0X2E4_9RHOB|nr:Na+/H+ antiporter subunit E [Hasllibacter halocynthiae]PRY93111.1 multisubunit sodium/proton antiporter MrpE subunit [Hasllibacter halocynthiae]
MRTLVANIMLTVVWVAFLGAFTPLTVISGFLLGTVVLYLLQPLMGAPTSYFRRAFYWAKLVAAFLYELVVSSVGVLWDIVTPRHRAVPAFVDVPLDVKSDTGILLVTNLISLTPGTLSLDVSPDRSTLRVHAMFAEDPEEVVRMIKQGMEKWVIDAVEERP